MTPAFSGCVRQPPTGQNRGEVMGTCDVLRPERWGFRQAALSAGSGGAPIRKSGRTRSRTIVIEVCYPKTENKKDSSDGSKGLGLVVRRVVSAFNARQHQEKLLPLVREAYSMDLSKPKMQTAVAITQSNESSRFDRLMAATVISLLAIDLALAVLVHLDTIEELRNMARLSVGSFGLWVLIATYCYCRWRGVDLAKLGDICQLAVWTLLVIPAISFLIPAAGRSPYPLVDSALAGIDARMHFQTVTVVHLISHLPHLRHALAITYGLLPILILGSLLIPTLCGRAVDSRRYIFAVIVAALVTTALFAFWPAVGPWTVEGFSPTRGQAAVTDNLHLLKSDKPLPAQVGGAVVAFPSFHVVLAVLSVIAVWNVRWARWPAFALGALICVSTVTTGWHYLIDLIGGLAVTYLAQMIANLVLESTPSLLASDLASDKAETIPA